MRPRRMALTADVNPTRSPGLELQPRNAEVSPRIDERVRPCAVWASTRTHPVRQHMARQTGPADAVRKRRLNRELQLRMCGAFRRHRVDERRCRARNGPAAPRPRPGIRRRSCRAVGQRDERVRVLGPAEGNSSTVMQGCGAAVIVRSCRFADHSSFLAQRDMNRPQGGGGGGLR